MLKLSEVICRKILDLRDLVGIGSPPSAFTTNTSEALNSVLKKGVCFKESQWPEFVQKMKCLVDAQHNYMYMILVCSCHTEQMSSVPTEYTELCCEVNEFLEEVEQYFPDPDN